MKRVSLLILEMTETTSKKAKEYLFIKDNRSAGQ